MKVYIIVRNSYIVHGPDKYSIESVYISEDKAYAACELLNKEEVINIAIQV